MVAEPGFNLFELIELTFAELEASSCFFTSWFFTFNLSWITTQ